MLFKIAFRNLFRHGRRSLVCLLTVAMGSGALWLFDGFNAGIMNQYKDNTIHAKYGHGQVNTKGYREQVFEKPWEHWLESPEPVLAKIQDRPEVDKVFPRISFFSMLSNGDITVAAKGLGVDGIAENEFFNTINIIKGSMLSDETDGMILGRGLARSLGVAVGDRVTVLSQTTYGSLNGLDFQVVGIFHTGLQEIDDSHFRVQIEQVYSLLDTKRVETVAIGLHQDEDWPQFASWIESSYPNLEATSFAVLDKVYYQNAVEWLGEQFAVIQIIILLVVTLSISNTVAFTVMERTPEIGNLRANGESVREVMSLLLLEGFLLGLAGSCLGLLIAGAYNVFVIPDGILMPPAPGLTRQFEVKIELQLLMAGKALILGAATSTIATLWAAYKRVRLPISAALRHR